jgi:hypothetical protein
MISGTNFSRPLQFSEGTEQNAFKPRFERDSSHVGYSSCFVTSLLVAEIITRDMRQIARLNCSITEVLKHMKAINYLQRGVHTPLLLYTMLSTKNSRRKLITHDNFFE